KHRLPLTSTRSTRASARRSATRRSSRRSPNGSQQPGCCSSLPALGSPRTGSTGSRERLPRPVVGAGGFRPPRRGSLPLLVAVDRADGHPPPGGLRRGGSTRLAVDVTAVRNPPRGGADEQALTDTIDGSRTKESRMSWYDDPVAAPTAGPAPEPAPAPVAAASHSGFGGARRVAAT